MLCSNASAHLCTVLNCQCIPDALPVKSSEVFVVDTKPNGKRPCAHQLRGFLVTTRRSARRARQGGGGEKDAAVRPPIVRPLEVGPLGSGCLLSWWLRRRRDHACSVLTAEWIWSISGPWRCVGWGSTCATPPRILGLPKLGRSPGVNCKVDMGLLSARFVSAAWRGHGVGLVEVVVCGPCVPTAEYTLESGML